MSYCDRLALGSLLELTEDGVRLLVGVDIDMSKEVRLYASHESDLILLVERTAFPDWKCILHLSLASRSR